MLLSKNYVIERSHMLSELKKFFGDNIEIGIIKEKPKLPLFLAMRNIYKVKINGICFMLIESGSDEKFGIKAFKKQIAIYEEVFQLHASFLFSDITRAQRDALIKNNIPFIKFPDQIYLPFFGIMLSNKIKGDKTINAEKMMPVTQQLYLYMLYKKSTCIPKYKAAEDLGCSRTSITRASSQLIIMGLITQKKQGKNAFMELKHSNKESLKKAGPYLINPIKNIITIRREDLPDSYFYAGESALSEYSMLNPPPIPEVAVYKDSLNEKTMNTLDSRWAEPNDELVHVELWNYDPALFSFEGKVDPVSLACTLKETDNERVEDAVNEMMEEWTW